MARKPGGRTPGRLTAGALVLDSQGLALAASDDLKVAGFLKSAVARDIRVVTSALTLIEAVNPKQSKARWDYLISRIQVEEVTLELTLHAMGLLRAAGLHGHKYAIDAVVAATAMACAGPVTMLTSDVDDMAKLCDPRVLLVQV
ncbi:DNA-binding protein [Kitasatospora sp. NPDC096147]|uniref:DNA-binding protein n=1 Tax=Kitasatospora sp. NPDC096147 TaxID=3364093 RepID=UPI00382F692B